MCFNCDNKSVSLIFYCFLFEEVLSVCVCVCVVVSTLAEKSTDVNDDSQDDVSSMEKIMDFFGEGFGSSSRQQRQVQRGSDLRYNMSNQLKIF